MTAETISLKSKKTITPEIVKSLKGPTDKFLCPISANIYEIDFLGFKIRDLDTNTVLLDIHRVSFFFFESLSLDHLFQDPNDPSPMADPNLDDSDRLVRYRFGPEFLKLGSIGTTTEFSIGKKPLKNLRMIENHYFKGKLLKQYDFTMPFCIPNTTNTWEVIYTLPTLSEKELKDVIAHPWETKSDTFYFVDNVLMIHNKAEYDYSELVV